MPKYVIERDIPGAGSVGPEEVRALSEKSNGVIADLGDVQWVQSYVTGDKLFCLYIAPSEDRVREHAARTGIPANSVHEVVGIVDPTTGGA
jgi:Nickel responsive protein SCO4226-like